jgi:tetratricopeptide (TPR) repeat protein
MERNDRAGTERFAELRRRFQRAAGITPAEDTAKSAQPASAAPPEFSVPVIEAELDEPVVEATPVPAPAEPMGIPMPVESVVHEVDLSDEWAALSEQLETAMKEETPGAVEEDAPLQDDRASAPVLIPADEAQMQAETAAEAPAFDLELQSAVPVGAHESETLAADSLMADLAGDLESITSSLGLSSELAHPSLQKSVPSSGAPGAPSARSTPGNGAPAAGGAGSLNGPLGDLFEEFRSELGESTNEDEDLETHYNLGIAYREMGLLEEAISEFQKVASAADKGPAFRYAMQCSTLLGLAFMEKGQPAIAAIWYERALKTPGLDQESILALRYDLGVAQDLAGDKQAAYNSFSQVYAMNIDYRDVSERIALLGKAR